MEKIEYIEGAVSFDGFGYYFIYRYFFGVGFL